MHLLGAATLFALALLAACGGGSDQAPDSQLLPDASQLDGAPCSDCRAGRLSGVAASGVALADAEVRIVDAQLRVASGRTDAQGRYDLDVSGLSGPLLVQVTGLESGRPVRMHSACRAAEIGTRAVNVTALTELIVAQTLAGRPGELLRAGRVDFFRIDAMNLRQAEMAVEVIVRPLLDLAGVAAQVDLRVTPFQVDRQGLGRALHWLSLEPAVEGYRLRHAAMPMSEGRVLTPGRLDGAAALPLDVAAGARLNGAIDALPGIETRLDALSALFAQGVPGTPALGPLLAPGFLDGGLDADAFVARVLQRHDAADAGGFSLSGARWEQPRIVAVADDGALRVRTRLTLPAPHAPREETAWWVPSASGWLLRGDGQPARVAVRNLAVLGPRALGEAELRALPGAVCPAVFETLPETVIDQRCRIHGGSDGLPSAGVLDLGEPGDALFGTLGLFRSAAAEPWVRLQEQRQYSRLLATPSQRVTRHLAFELDARRADPRAMRARVFGPGLPAAGLLLSPPARVAGVPVAEYWTLAGEAGDDWQSVPLGWCEAASDDAEAAACRRAWAELHAGAAYRFVLLDAAGTALGEVDATLPDTPEDEARLAAEMAQRFARFELQAQAALQPTLAQALGDADAQPDSGSVLAARLPWSAPADARQRVIEATLDWWRAGLPPHAGEEIVRRRRHATGSGELNEQVSARPGFRSHWLVARVVAQDPLGNRYLHFVAPNNPF